MSWLRTWMSAPRTSSEMRRTVCGRRSASYDSRSVGAARPFVTAATFQARLCASRSPLLSPWPANGGDGRFVVCLELMSHVQPPAGDVAQVVAHSLFSDAAVAVAMMPTRAAVAAAGSSSEPWPQAASRDGFEVVDQVSGTDADHTRLMTWDVTNLGFRMGLSPKVAHVLAQHSDRYHFRTGSGFRAPRASAEPCRRIEMISTG